jgi:hypothetical protein
MMRREIVQIIQRMLRSSQKMLCFVILEGICFY